MITLAENVSEPFCPVMLAGNGAVRPVTVARLSM
jgi:hypothetical protein